MSENNLNWIANFIWGIAALRNRMRHVDGDHASKTSHDSQSSRKNRALHKEKREGNVPSVPDFPDFQARFKAA